MSDTRDDSRKPFHKRPFSSSNLTNLVQVQRVRIIWRARLFLSSPWRQSSIKSNISLIYIFTVANGEIFVLFNACAVVFSSVCNLYSSFVVTYFALLKLFLHIKMVLSSNGRNQAFRSILNQVLPKLLQCFEALETAHAGETCWWKQCQSNKNSDQTY